MTGHTTWFASFAPYEKPRYAVVVMVEDGVRAVRPARPSPGKIYSAILERSGPTRETPKPGQEPLNGNLATIAHV